MTTERADVVIAGAGVAGLVLALDLARAGADVVVLESSGEVGGLLRRGELDGIAIDLGAESFATRTTGVADLIADAGLDLEIVAPAPGGAHLAVMADAGVLRAPLPQRTVLGVPADPLAADVVRILGADAAARAAAERDLPPYDADRPEPSLGELVAERCGPDLVARLVDPLCRSVYSQPATAARLSRLHPAMWAEVRRTGSLLRAADAVASTSRTGSAVGGIAGGMWRLPAELRAAAEAAGAQVRTGTAVRGVHPAPRADRIVVDTAGAELTARAVVVATGARAAVALLAGADGGGRSDAPREDVGTTGEPVRVVASLVRSAALDAHPVGSGVIVASDVPSRAKALTHASAKWPWLGHERGHVVRLSARDADAPGLDTAADVAREIALLTGTPLDARDIVALTSARWDDAVAAAPVSPARRDELAAAGIHLAGAQVAGTGLASVVPDARALAAALTSTLANSTAVITTGSPA